jgi:oligopeptide transport system ATP-binding protein
LSLKILEAHNLSVRFHTNEGIVHAVNGISLVVHKGETLGIVGESGCGKSVSMLSMMKLLPQSSAEISAESIRFCEKEIAEATEEEMCLIRGSQMAMIFQDPMTSFNPVLTVGFQIMEPLRLKLGMSREEARDRACKLLHMVGIPDADKRLGDYPHQFSGGMRQRAMIAMALTCNPSLLIADEPTTALDVTIQAQIVELVKRLKDQFGMALIWITHDLGVIAGVADRVCVMYAGFIVEEGAIDEIYYHPSHPYTRALLQSQPRIDDELNRQLEAIQGTPPELYHVPPGCPFAPRCLFVKPICAQQKPCLDEKEPGHKIACWVNITTGEIR